MARTATIPAGADAPDGIVVVLWRDWPDQGASGAVVTENGWMSVTVPFFFTIL